MKLGRNNLLIATGIAILCFILNSTLFIYFYNRLATPYISEEQRVANADYIMVVVTGGFAGASLLIGMLVYLILKNGN